MSPSRRDVLKTLALGSGGFPFGWSAWSCGPSRPTATPKAKVVLRTGTDRRTLISEVLSPLEPQLRTALADRSILVKPNFVVSSRPLCATHVDAVRGLLDVLTKFTDRPVTIAESPASADAPVAFENYGYLDLVKEYGATLVDLNAGPTEETGGILLNDGTTATVRLTKPLLEREPFIVSIGRPKTHDTVVATLTVKNMIMAAPLRLPRPAPSDKVTMHGGKNAPIFSEYLTRNMFALADRLLPDLAVVDGVEGMEGNGPVRGTAVDHGFALAGFDAGAVDSVGSRLMGIDPKYLPYLSWCGDAGLGTFDSARISVDGPDPAGLVRTYALHETFETQVAWIERAGGSPQRITPPPQLRVLSHAAPGGGCPDRRRAGSRRRFAARHPRRTRAERAQPARSPARPGAERLRLERPERLGCPRASGRLHGPSPRRPPDFRYRNRPDLNGKTPI